MPIFLELFLDTCTIWHLVLIIIVETKSDPNLELLAYT